MDLSVLCFSVHSVSPSATFIAPLEKKCDWKWQIGITDMKNYEGNEKLTWVIKRVIPDAQNLN